MIRGSLRGPFAGAVLLVTGAAWSASACSDGGPADAPGAAAAGGAAGDADAQAADAGAADASVEDGGALRVLFLGDSYTYVNDLPGMLTSIAATSGTPPAIVTDEVVQGGATLEDLWDGGLAQAKIADGTWTHVVLQGQSVEPLALPGPASTFQDYAAQLGDLIVAAGAQPTFFATWARAAGDPAYSPLPYGVFTCPAEMQDELTVAYATAAAREPRSVLVCVGEAFQRSLAEHPAIVLQQTDRSHPTVAGTYLAASTFYVALTGRPVPSASAVPDGLPADDAAALRDVARVGRDCRDVKVKGAVSTSFPIGADGGAAPFDFGTAGFPVTTELELANTGGATVGVDDAKALAPPFVWTAGGAYPGGSGPGFCTGSLAPGSSCTISVTYTAASSATGSLTLGFTGDTYLPSATCPLVGTATARALLTVSDNPGLFSCTDADCSPSPIYSFPGGTGSLVLYVLNRGAAPVTALAEGTPLGAPFAWTGGAFPGGTGEVTLGAPLTSYPYCTDTLGVGESCVVSLTFSPAALGTFAGAVNLAYADAAGPLANANRNLEGTSAPPKPP